MSNALISNILLFRFCVKYKCINFALKVGEKRRVLKRSVIGRSPSDVTTSYGSRRRPVSMTGSGLCDAREAKIGTKCAINGWNWVCYPVSLRSANITDEIILEADMFHALERFIFKRRFWQNMALATALLSRYGASSFMVGCSIHRIGVFFDEMIWTPWKWAKTFGNWTQGSGILVGSWNFSRSFR